MLKHKPFLLLLIALVSCHGDIDKSITTNLQEEGNEIFRISFALDESRILAFQNLEYYRAADTLQLAGCPTVTVTEGEKKINLSFPANRNCVIGASIPRAGSLELEYINTGALELTIRMRYIGYKVKGISIEGVREFKQTRGIINPNKRTELFEDLLIIDEKGNSSRISGRFEHLFNSNSNGEKFFTTSGSIEGRNVTGRKITMSPGNPRRYSLNCINTDFVLPLEGNETWQIFRNEQLATSHAIRYSTDAECLAKATITLHDGRVLTYQQ